MAHRVGFSHSLDLVSRLLRHLFLPLPGHDVLVSKAGCLLLSSSFPLSPLRPRPFLPFGLLRAPAAPAQSTHLGFHLLHSSGGTHAFTPTLNHTPAHLLYVSYFIIIFFF